jgi:APA family basic amino acid/polyamine antiporter
MSRRTVGSPSLFAVIYTLLASAIYFSLGAVGNHAVTLTPLVYLAAGVFFVLAAMTYVEGASLHQERAGATVFARYAFNELWSFVAGWALLLDYVILIAVTTFSATNYLAAYWGELGHGATEIILELALIAYVGVRNVMGFSAGRAERIRMLVLADFALQVALIVAGLILFFDWGNIVDPIDLGHRPTWGGLVFALGLSSVVFIGLESASGLSGEVAISRRGLKRLIASAAGAVMVIYVGLAVVAVTALPIGRPGGAISGSWLEAPLLSVARAFDDRWDTSAVRYVVAAAAAATLIAGANSAMLGLSRLAYSLATNRQIPSAVGRLHPTRSTPFVVIAIACVLAAAIGVPADMDFLVGIIAFGALLGLTIAHLSVCVLRYKEPERDRPFRAPFSVRVGGGDLPIPSVLGAVLSAAAWIGVMATHQGARYVGLGWMAVGLFVYVVYRTTQGKSLTRRVVVPAEALRERDVEAEYGSILVPIFGTPLDDDIVQTAGRLAADEGGDDSDDGGATIEALWVFEVPMALPIDARLPEAQLERARAALRRAKAVGEEYEGVEVATATVRARRAGHAIVEEARRRGVEVIVLAAEEPSRIRGGAVLGGRATLDNFVGDVTKYVIDKATCRVILTAPPAHDRPGPGPADLAAGGVPTADASIGAAPKLDHRPGDPPE